MLHQLAPSHSSTDTGTRDISIVQEIVHLPQMICLSKITIASYFFAYIHNLLKYIFPFSSLHLKIWVFKIHPFHLCSNNDNNDKI